MQPLQYFFFFSSRRRHTRCSRDWSSDVCSSDLVGGCVPAQSSCSTTATGTTLMATGGAPPRRFQGSSPTLAPRGTPFARSGSSGGDAAPLALALVAGGTGGGGAGAQVPRPFSLAR